MTDPTFVRADHVVRMPGTVSGLYGIDEDDLYDAYVKPAPDGRGFDVIRPATT
jgi:hypothetical protein